MNGYTEERKRYLSNSIVLIICFEFGITLKANYAKQLIFLVVYYAIPRTFQNFA